MKFLNSLYFALSKKNPTVFEELYEYFKEKYFSENLGRYDNFKFGTGTLIKYNLVVIAIFGGIILAAALSIYNKRYLGNFVRKIIKDGASSPESAKTVEELGFKNSFMIKLSLMGGNTFGKMIRCVEADQYYASMLGENSAFPPAESADAGGTSSEAADTESAPADNEGFVQESADAVAENTGAEVNESSAPESQEEKIETPEERHDRLLSSIKPYKIDPKCDHFYIREEDRYAAEFRYAKKGTNWLVFVFVVILSIILAGAVCYFIPDMLQLVDNFLTTVKK